MVLSDRTGTPILGAVWYSIALYQVCTSPRLIDSVVRYQCGARGQVEDCRPQVIQDIIINPQLIFGTLQDTTPLPTKRSHSRDPGMMRDYSSYNHPSYHTQWLSHLEGSIENTLISLPPFPSIQQSIYRQ